MAPHRRLVPERDGPSASSPRLASHMACLSAPIDPGQRFPSDRLRVCLSESGCLPACNGLETVGSGGETEAAGLIDLPTWVVGWHFGPLIPLEHVPSVEPSSNGPGRPVPCPFRFSPCSHLHCPGVSPRSPPVDGLSWRRILAAGLALPLNHTVGVPNDALWLLHLATAGCGRRWAS